jgi:serine/threonine-protein kinase RsbW
MRLDLTMPGHTSSVCLVVGHVLAIAVNAGYDDGAQHDIELALREALANAVRHGTKNDPSKLIRCRVTGSTRRGLLIVVKDSGEGFNPETIPSCLVEQNLLLPHGRGIYLICQLMDAVRFKQGGTEIHMFKRPEGRDFRYRMIRERVNNMREGHHGNTN